MSSLRITVRKNPKNTNLANYYYDEVSKEFVEHFLGIDFEMFCLKFEAFAMLGLSDIGRNENKKKTYMKTIIRNMIRLQLRESCISPAVIGVLTV